ncbi:MAG TPA: hypothetical protein VFX30_05455 [bacterium]|nr:hypothetical protein [bacterium]
MDSFNGVDIAQYAKLCALMIHTGNDETKEIAIAEANGVKGPDWLAAKKAWTAKMSDPSDMGKTAMAFFPIYQKAQEDARGGKEPISLEDYARLCAEINCRISPMDPKQKMERAQVLAKFGHTESQYLEFNTYWAEIVGEAKSPRFDKAKHEVFAGIIQKVSDEINGIKR